MERPTRITAGRKESDVKPYPMQPSPGLVDEEWIRPRMIDLSKRIYKGERFNKLHQLPSTGHSSFHTGYVHSQVSS